MNISNLISLCILLVTFSYNFSSVKADCNNGYCDEDDLPVGWIIAAVILGLLLFIGAPILLCFCCAWACFRGRGRKGGDVHVVYAAPPPGSYPVQSGQGTYPGQHGQQVAGPGWTVYNGQGQGHGQGQPRFYAPPQPQQHYSPYSRPQSANH